MFVGTLPDRASPSTSPRGAPLDHVNGFAVLATRGERNAFADSFPISRLGSPEIAPFSRVARTLAGLCQSCLRQHCSPGFPRRASTEPRGMNPSGTLAIRRTLLVTRLLRDRGGSLGRDGGTDRGASVCQPREGMAETWPEAPFTVFPRLGRSPDGEECTVIANPCLRPGTRLVSPCLR